MKLLNLLLLPLAAQFMAPAVQAQASCPGNGAGEPGCAAVGNPINVITGNKFQREVDLAPLPGVMGLEIVRYYNSSLSGLNSRTGILGRGWRLSYETTIAAIGDTVQVLQADGTRLIFARDLLRPSLCSSADPANGEIDVRRTTGGDEYVWRKTDGQHLSFNTQGRLVQILAPTGEFVSMQHDARGWLVKVTDPQGRSLTLDYLKRKGAAAGTRFAGVQGIDSPVGRFAFGYGSELPEGANAADRRQLLANLAQVTMPDGGGRKYHYEDVRFPTLMTGISIEDRNAGGEPVLQRHATYAYDGNAMAVSSSHANGVGRITLDHSVGGQTVLTNSLGQKTVYRYSLIAGSLRIREVRGPGCVLCGPTNIRYGYDRQGRINDVTRLGDDGVALETIHTDLDHYGRPTRISRVHYKDGKAGKPQWQQRFEYAQGTALKPILIARPSVVPGLEQATRIHYGDAPATRTVPMRIADNGYVPTYDGAGASGEISRVMHYRYDDRGRRIESDGPLENAAQNPGPENSDITRIEYDPQAGLPSRTIAPGNLVAEVLERDGALRPVKVRSSDGYRMQTATIRSNWRGQPEAIQIEAVRLLPDGRPDPASALTRSITYRYDVQGRIEAIIAPGQLTTRFAYDAAGRMTHRTLPDGSRFAVQLDTEGRKTSESRYLDDAEAALATTRYRYDDEGRLKEVADGIGIIGRLDYTSPGEVAELTDGLGMATRLAYDDNGLLVMRTQAADTQDASTTRFGHDSRGMSTAITDGKGVRTDLRYDDFGRKVFESSPDRGLMLYVHDDGGRMVARIDETMATTRYRYDHAGRLIAVGTDRDVELLRYRYEGLHRVGMLSTTDGNPAQAVERVSSEYDAFGQPVREEHWLARVHEPEHGVVKVADSRLAKSGLTFITERQYDEAGRLVLQRLPDGHRLRYRYTPGRSMAEKGRPGQLNAILFDEQVVVTEIEQSVAGGLTGYTHGNGVRQGFALDLRRRIVDLNATTLTAPPELSAIARWWRKLKAWAAGREPSAGTLVYRQSNIFDQGNRMTSSRRIHGRVNTSDGAPTERIEGYRYDGMDRLAEVQVNGRTVSRIAYDKNGNRISASDVGHVSYDRSYRYQTGTNRLSFVSMDGRKDGQLLQSVTQAWMYHPTGVPLTNMRLSYRAGGRSDVAPARWARRITYNSARRPVAVHEADGQPVARYFYNSAGERIAKSVTGNGKVVTSYGLYDAQRLIAEADEAGRITEHYIYLYGKPVAKVALTSRPSTAGRVWGFIRTLGGALLRDAAEQMDTRAHIYAIHTDHIGMPQAVTDKDANLVWQGNSDPFGKLQVAFAKMSTDGQEFDMKLRLPGQVSDAETGLHQNYYRDYDPEQGRYTTADPIGLAGGMNPYEYAGSNPLSNIDPLGLYQSDVHYYMTYFLAIVAGMGADDARTMALAAQYIDDNPDTHPLDDTNIGTIITSPLWNKENLAKYHFVLWTQVPGEKAVFDKSTNIDKPLEKSPQLETLLRYARDFDAKNCKPNNTSLQLMGEFLHTFQDTYAHRSPENLPFPLNGGVGHGFYGSHPDYTYDHESWRLGFSWEPPFVLVKDKWANNESRTLAMELAAYEQIVEYMSARNYKTTPDRSGAKTPINDARVMDALRAFNACRVDEQSAKNMQTCDGTSSEVGDKVGMAAKIDILNQALIDLGYDERLQWAPEKNGGEVGYDVREAADNRLEFLKGLSPDKYPSAILPKDK